MKDVHKISRRSWNSNFAIQDLVRLHIVSIQGLVAAFVYLDHGLVEADSSKDAFGTRIRENFRIQF